MYYRSVFAYIYRVPLFVFALFQHWKLVCGHASAGLEHRITKEQYVMFFAACAKVLMPDEDIPEDDIAVRASVSVYVLCVGAADVLVSFGILPHSQQRARTGLARSQAWSTGKWRQREPIPASSFNHLYCFKHSFGFEADGICMSLFCPPPPLRNCPCTVHSLRKCPCSVHPFCKCPCSVHP
jgi:hypothetical protein